MTPEQLICLDAISDRIGDLYREVGRVAPEETGLLDEIVELIAAVEKVSNRKARLNG